MTDIHTHILPGIDDGPRSVETSIAMLRAEAAEGINSVALTPHFYPQREGLASFMHRRRHAFEKLSAAVENEFPENTFNFYLGSELYYFDGIERADGIEDLRIGDTGLLLLELPFIKWNAKTVDSVINLANTPGFHVVLAHIERYARFQDEGTLSRLLNNGVYFQSNAEVFTERRRRRGAIHMLRDGMIHFIGSDCHNTDDRAPGTAAAREIIQKKLGSEPLQRLHDLELKFGLK